MALFHSENTPAEGVNYQQTEKERTVYMRKSEFDALRRRLDAAAALEAERNRLAQQVAALTAENEALRSRPAAPQRAAEPAAVTEPGSIAEQAVKISGVMEAAQTAADEYLAKIKEMHDKMCLKYSEHEVLAQMKADAIIKNANEEAESIVQKARGEANAIWSALQAKFDGYVADKKQN